MPLTFLIEGIVRFINVHNLKLTQVAAMDTGRIAGTMATE